MQPEGSEPVSLYVDASYCNRTGAAAWASCIVSIETTHFSSGDLPAEVKSSAVAEAFALKSAVKSAIGLGFIPPRARVILYTDFIGHLDLLAISGGDSVRGRVSIALGKQVERHGIMIEVRHVKAHTPPADRTPEQTIHARVDRLARQRMKSVRLSLIRRKD